MPQAGYFKNFPTVTYSNTTVLNICARVDVTRRIRANPRNFYNLTIPDGVRADRAAQAYYGDPSYAWLVYVSGQVIDPYYGWPLNFEAFNDFVINKYGSIVLAQQVVHHWQVDWAAFSDTTITVGYYRNTLPSDQTQYYEPIFGVGTTAAAYRLRRVDWTETTNKIISLTISNVAPGNVLVNTLGQTYSKIVTDTGYSNGFLLEEPVYVKTGNVVIGNAQITWTNSNTVIVKHVTGNVSANGTTLFGVITGSTANIVSQTPAVNNIPNDQQVFWGPVSCYDYEMSKNRDLQQTKLVDARYSIEAQKELVNLLNPNTALQQILPFMKTLITGQSGG